MTAEIIKFPEGATLGGVWKEAESTAAAWFQRWGIPLDLAEAAGRRVVERVRRFERARMEITVPVDGLVSDDERSRRTDAATQAARQAHVQLARVFLTEVLELELQVLRATARE